MGMYDGYDRDRGSSAEVARLLGIPVVLVVDAKSAAYSMAPLLSGFINFRPDIRIAGVIFNRVGSPHHYRMLQEVCEDLNVTCLGYLPKQKELEQESRHLGLDFSRSKETEGLDMLAGLLEEHVDWELLLSTIGLPLPAAAVEEKSVLSEPGKLHISVARNEVVLFLPLCGASGYSALYGHGHFLQSGAGPGYSARDGFALSARRLSREPSGGTCRGKACQGVYPQLYRGWWQDAGRMRGMIYLSQSVLSDGDTDGGGSDTDGRSTGNSVSNVGNEMVGVLPFSITNERKRRKLTLGYRRFDYNGWRLKGHEFHYTQLAVPEAGGKESGAYSLTPSIVQVFNARGEKVATPIFRIRT